MTAATYRRLRESIGTQEEVAKMLGVSARTIARRERGELITKEAEIALKHLAERKPNGPDRV